MKQLKRQKKSERNYVSGLEIQDILWRNLGIHCCKVGKEYGWLI